MKMPNRQVRSRLIWNGIALLTLGVAAITAAASRNHEAPAQEKSATSDQSTNLHDQSDLNVTVYNSNIALIRDVRNLTLPAGTFPPGQRTMHGTRIPPS